MDAAIQSDFESWGGALGESLSPIDLIIPANVGRAILGRAAFVSFVKISVVNLGREALEAAAQHGIREGTKKLMSNATAASLAKLNALIRRPGAAEETASLLTRLRRFFWDPRDFKTQISPEYWARRGGSLNGADLHHWLFPRAAWLVPRGLRNAGFNLFVLHGYKGIFHRTLPLNRWMGFAPNWHRFGGHDALAMDWLIRLSIPGSFVGFSYVVDQCIGHRVYIFLNTLEREYEESNLP
jgi:hypothetical protein